LSGPRVALIGARRSRQGLGPFVARDLCAAGAEIAGFLTTREETLAAAGEELEKTTGQSFRGYTDVDQLLANERPDALAVLSPAETHERYLDAALAAGAHVLCEKPFLWSGDGLAARARRRVDAFAARGLLLVENCQWPHALAAFDALHPTGRSADGAPQRFAMRLSPTSSGAQRIGDCLPHPLSVLQSLSPGAASIEQLRFPPVPNGVAGLELEFDYVVGGARTGVSLQFLSDSEYPRPAWIEIDGLRAERRVRMPDYAIEFACGTRSVSAGDPLTLHVLEFVKELRAVGAGATPRSPEPIAQRMELLEQVLVAHQGA